MGIKENLENIKEQIGNNNVKIIAVTKYATELQLSRAYKVGIRDFGESYVQDAIKKITQKFPDEKTDDLVHWHFIGKLQKNKAKYVVGSFSLIHSVDSTELAELIDKIAKRKEVTQDVLLQLNISAEATKIGFNIDELKGSFEKLLKLPNIRIVGLMTIAPRTESEEVIRSCFLELFNVKAELNKEYGLNLKELSMGMTNDYKIAIECGATMIRLGRAIFKSKEDK